MPIFDLIPDTMPAVQEFFGISLSLLHAIMPDPAWQADKDRQGDEIPQVG